MELQKWLAQADDPTPFQRQGTLNALAASDPDRASHNVIEERIADERGWHCPPSPKHQGGGRVKERIFHIQKANDYDSRLKGWMQRFNRVATGYLTAIWGGDGFLSVIKEVATNPKTWLIEPRNGSWAQKSRVRYWCAW